MTNAKFAQICSGRKQRGDEPVIVIVTHKLASASSIRKLAKGSTIPLSMHYIQFTDREGHERDATMRLDRWLAWRERQ